jgi:hypothetical protein
MNVSANLSQLVQPWMLICVCMCSCSNYDSRLSQVSRVSMSVRVELVLHLIARICSNFRIHSLSFTH